jgi:hypothetical protein
MSSKPLESIDLDDVPELRQIAEKVRATARPILLRRGEHALAMIAPVGPPGEDEPRERSGPTKPDQRGRSRRITDEDLAAFRSAAGAWADVDTDKLIEEIYAARIADDRPPVEL